MSSDIVFVSAEPSGDDLSVSVIKSLRENDNTLAISAIGGGALDSVGLTSPIDVTPLSVLGLFEGLKVYPKVVSLADQAADFIVRQDPEIAVLVDSWGFMLRVAQRLKKRAPHIRLVKLVGPQVWATRAGRAKTLSKLVDHLLCIHEMEVPYYEPYGLPCTVIGNPALDRLKPGDGERYREAQGVLTDNKLLLVLPGSRKSEIERVAPDLAAAASLLKKKYGARLKVFVLVARSVASLIRSKELVWPEGTQFEDRSEQKADLMAAADVAMACSGTVTTELASQGCPMVIGYRMGALTWTIADGLLYKPEFATLFNIAAEREIAKELLQGALTPENLVHATERLLEDETRAEQQVKDQFNALKRMGLGGRTAPDIAAQTLLDILQ